MVKIVKHQYPNLFNIKTSFIVGTFKCMIDAIFKLALTKLDSSKAKFSFHYLHTYLVLSVIHFEKICFQTYENWCQNSETILHQNVWMSSDWSLSNSNLKIKVEKKLDLTDTASRI